VIVDFATFCFKGDAHRLHAPGQLRRQVESNAYLFNQIIVVHQLCNPADYPPFDLDTKTVVIDDLDAVLRRFNIDPDKPQYTSTTDQAHHYKYHVVNHLAAVEASRSDYIVFADADCWMVEQPPGQSWVYTAMQALQLNPNIFIVSPNDGEEKRLTRRMSQQMFMARTEEFRQADFDQPGWDGNVNVPGGPMPEYWGMLEGRMELYCRKVNQYRYVLGPEYRGWHFNRINPTTDHFELDRSKY
jgi:hypothetical protein